MPQPRAPVSEPLPRPPPAADVDDALELVEARMRRLADGGPDDRCGSIVAEHLDAGGRRMRAWLALETAQSLGVPPGAAIGWAAACELLHNASLVHDDIQDGDRHRRGAPTAWVRHGVPQAIVAGDLLLVLPVLALGDVGARPAVRWHLAETLHAHAARTARGQALDLGLRASRAADRESYNRVASAKTGAFFALPVHGSALIAGLAPRRAATLGAAFDRLGVLYQLVDDIVDLYGEKGRAAVGADVREGKVSALVVEHLRLHPEDADWLWAILDRPRAATTSAVVAEVAARFDAGGALDAVLARIESLAAAAATVPTLQSVPALRPVATRLIARMQEPLQTIVRPVATA